MKKITRSFIAVLMAMLMALGLSLSVSAAAADDFSAPADYTLRFNEDGKFKLIIFSDCQDFVLADARMLKFMEAAVEAEQPDLAVFLGDNLVQPVAFLHEQAARTLMAPLAKRGIPFAYVFGNHDAERISKELIHKSFLKSGATCLTYDAAPDITGFGNCNLPILASGSDEIAFNLWMIDSNMYDEVNGGYDYVHEDQIAWYQQTSQALEAQAGHKVNSLMFQHIILPEIFDCMVPATQEDENAVQYNGQFYLRQLLDENNISTEHFGEKPAPSKTNSGFFSAIVERGDVLGIATGHDHINSFIARKDGIDLIQVSGMSFSSYGDEAIRGYRTITLDESDTTSYETEVHTYKEYYPDENRMNVAFELVKGYLQELFKIFNTLMKTITNIIKIAKK